MAKSGNSCVFLYNFLINKMINLIAGIDCKVDSKGRVLLPTTLKNQLQEVLSQGFIVKRSIYHKCLELYPRSAWETQVEHLNKLNLFIKKNVDFIRIFTAGIRELELDATFRLQIPKDLVEFAGLKSDVVLASATTYLEIWDKTAYEAALSSVENIEELAETVMGNIPQ